MRFVLIHKNKIVLFCFLLFIGIFFVFLQGIKNSNYVGVMLKQDIHHKWVINKVYPGSEAEMLKIPIGAKIISIDQQDPWDQVSVRKWFVINKAQEMKIEDNGKIVNIVFSSENSKNIYKYLFMTIITLVAMFIALFTFYKWTGSKQVLYLALVSLTNGIGFLVAIPSSEGQFIGRVCLYLTLLWLPTFIIHFTFRFLINKRVAIIKYIPTLFFCLSIIGTIFMGIHIVYSLPYFLIEWLNSFIFIPFAVGIFTSIFILLVHLMSNISKKEKYQTVLFALALLISFLPFYLFYIFAGQHIFPFIITILFFPLHLLVAFFILILNGSIPFSQSIPILFFRGMYSVMTVILTYNLFLFVNTQNKWMIAFFGVILTSTLYLFYQKLDNWNLTRRNKFQKTVFQTDTIDINDNLIIIAKEMEREKIMMLIHDNIIQNVVGIIRNLRELEKQSANKKLVKNVIDDSEDILYQLRDLCTDIYPSMIEDLGLAKTTISFVKETMKNHIVNIVLNMEQCDETHISVPVKHVIFRMMKELVTNVIKHAKAKQIEILLTINQNWITVVVQDVDKE
ncbi:sensor histidine kinase [Niallia sp. 01092]|uniref:sensor histidine kinase n=1 Tax=unclassified Niallia TaxID=2837522 RepID=UPI003FD044CA